jgi:nucleotide-binding universal stress UspA family protein
MRIVNPTFGLSAAGGEKIALKPVNWKTDAIALISNSKPNARELLEGVRARLGAHRQIDNIKFHAKNSASQPAPKELLQEVAKNYKAALLALGD